MTQDTTTFRRILIAIIFFTGLVTFAQPNLLGVLTDGGPNGAGTLFTIDAATQTLQVKHAFNNTDGASPHGNLLYATNGMYYGTTNEGGSQGYGTLFQFDPLTNQLTTKFNFDYFNLGGYNYGQLTQLDNGDIVGVCSSGGIYGYGTIWKYSLDNNIVTKLADLDDQTGAFPYTGVMQASNGKLYGVTTNDGAGGFGTLYEFDLNNNAFTIRQNFDYSNGAFGYAQLIEVNGELFGVTYFGGSGGAGTIFKYDLNTSLFATVHSFNYGANGGMPYGGGLQLADNGLLYGTTSVGGQAGEGTLFSFNPASGIFNKLHDFTVAQGPSYSPVMQASDGLLYGMTYQGFANNVFDNGSIFKFDLDQNTYSTIKSFDSSTGGKPILAGLAEHTAVNPLDCSPSGINPGSIAFEGSFIPNTNNVITSQAPATPIVGEAGVEYIWMKSPVNVPNTLGNPYWTVVEGSINQLQLELDPLIATTYFIRCSRLEGCDMYWGETNIVEVPVDLCSPNYINSGSIGFEGSFNPNETNIVQNIEAGSSDFGEEVNIEYVWLQSPVNVPNTVGNPHWKLVPGSHNQLSLTVSGLVSTTYFIRCARAESCDMYWGETNIVEVPVDLCSPNYINSGSISFEGSYNPNETNIVQNIEAGSSDFGEEVNIEYVWLQSPVNVPNIVGNPYWKLVPGSHNQLSLTVTGLVSTTYFIRCARAESCTKYWGETNIVEVPVDLCGPDFIHGGEVAFSGPYIPGSENIITNEVSATSDFGDDLNMEYIWLTNDEDVPFNNGSNGWELIEGSTEATYTIGELLETTYFIRCARVDGCIVYYGESNIVEVTVDKCLPDFIQGGEISFSGIYNPNHENTIANAVSATSDFGNEIAIEYIWLSNDEDVPFNNGSNGWELIEGSTDATYTIGELSETTYFIRCARVDGCIVYYGESNIVEVLVDKCLPDFIHGGEISFSGIYNPNHDNTITNAVSATSDFGGEVEYIWLSNDEDVPFNDGSNGWELIEGSTDATYTLGELLETTYFIRCARLNGCIVYYGESNIVEVTVDKCLPEFFNAGEIAFEGSYNPNSTNEITNEVSATSDFGGDVSVQYSWFSNQQGNGADGWELIEGAVDASYTIPLITVTTHFIRKAKVTGCNEFMGLSNNVVVEVNACTVDNIDAGRIALKDDDDDDHQDKEDRHGNHEDDDDDDHPGKNINPFIIISIVDASSPYGEVEYAWAQSTKKSEVIIGGGDWTLIPGATSKKLYVEDIKRKMYYVRLAKLPDCDDYVAISNMVPVTPRSLDNNRGGKIKQAVDFKCYPNPSIAGQATQLEFENDNSPEMEVRVYNSNGTQSKYQKYELTKGKKNVISLSLEGLTSGLYYMEIRKGDNKEIKRLMVR